MELIVVFSEAPNVKHINKLMNSKILSDRSVRRTDKLDEFDSFEETVSYQISQLLILIYRIYMYI